MVFAERYQEAAFLRVAGLEAWRVPTCGRPDEFTRVDAPPRVAGLFVRPWRSGPLTCVEPGFTVEGGPYDLDAIVASVKKTGRCVVVHEATLTSGFGAELSALVQENCFYHLEAPIVRVAGWDTPYPHAQEWDYFPGPARVGRALKAALES